MIMKKKEIYEVLDSDGNLIGKNDFPHENTNQISADGTTDHNSGIGHQSYSHDFLGRFGFYMFNEGEGTGEDSRSTDEILMSIAREAYVYFDDENDNLPPFESLEAPIQDKYKNFAGKVLGILNQKSVPVAEPELEPNLTEAEIGKMIEDIVTSRLDKSLAKRDSDNDVIDPKIKGKLKLLLGGLSKEDKSELIQHLKQ